MILAMLAAAAAKSAILYTAAGTEPFWGLTIYRRSMVLDDASAERKIRAPTPKPTVTRTSITYASKRMTVQIRHEGCNDGMSDTIDSDTVEVIVGEGRFRGCGGPEVLPRHVAGSSWDVETINGESIPYVEAETFEHRRELFTIHWQLNSTVHANLGCGELLGRYRAANGRIVSIEPLRPRAGRCAHQALERKAAGILAQPLMIRWIEDDQAEIRNSRGVIRLRRRY